MIDACRHTDINGDDVIEIVLPNRRVIFFIESNGAIGWAIASKPDSVRDGSGWIEKPSDWLAVLARGLAE